MATAVGRPAAERARLFTGLPRPASSARAHELPRVRTRSGARVRRRARRAHHVRPIATPRVIVACGPRWRRWPTPWSHAWVATRGTGRGQRAARGAVARAVRPMASTSTRPLLASRGRRPALGDVQPEGSARPRRTLDWSYLKRMQRRLARLVPITADLGIKKAWAATIEYTPDHLRSWAPWCSATARRWRSRSRVVRARHDVGTAVARMATDLALTAQPMCRRPQDSAWTG